MPLASDPVPLLLAALVGAACQDEQPVQAEKEEAATPWGLVMTALALAVGGYFYATKPPPKKNPFLEKGVKKVKKKKPEPEAEAEQKDHSHGHQHETEHQHGPGCGHDHGHNDGKADAHGHGHGGEKPLPMPPEKPQPTPPEANEHGHGGAMPPEMIQLFQKLDKSPTFTLVNKQGHLAAGPDGRARFFIAFEEAMAQLTAISAKGGGELLLNVVGLGRAVATAAQGKGMVIGRKEDAELAATLQVTDDGSKWNQEMGLPLFYSPVMMLQTPDGQRVRPLFVDGGDGSLALDKAKAQIAAQKADVPKDAMTLRVLPLQHFMQMMMEGQVKHSVLQPSSRALKAIAEIEASAKAAEAEADGIVSGPPPPGLKEVD